MNPFGFVRITVASPKVVVGNPQANVEEMQAILKQTLDSDIVLFPELGVTGYTCANLFFQSALLRAAEEALLWLVESTRGRKQLVVAGAPLAVGNSLYNCAVAIGDGGILGAVPKQFLPNYREFYELRWFRPADGKEPREIVLGGRNVPFGIDLLFDAGQAVVGVEICEDLWMPIPPSSWQTLAGANILLNPSASNETVGKCQYRTELVVNQSGRCLSAYAYSSSGPTESTTDLVFGGHCLIAENGQLLAESPRVGDGEAIRRDSYFVTADVDVERLQNDRRMTTSFDDCPQVREFRRIPTQLAGAAAGPLQRPVDGTPFVPGSSGELHRRCGEIFGIQCAGMAKRIEQLPSGVELHIGVSGGLDSTLALLAAVKTCRLLGLPPARIRGYTLPGFGTTGKTRSNALRLMELLGISSETIDICELALQSFREMGHKPFGIDCSRLDVAQLRDALAQVPRDKRHDLVFENVQARLRTFLLMNKGFVIGTGDLTELALGWCTYNADHMSMYNPNCSIPKTLVKFLVRYVAENEFPSGPTRDTLLSIVETTISPELLPAGADGSIEQSTEDALGPLELHDFFLFHVVRNSFSPAKILYLARQAGFTQNFSPSVIRTTLATFYRRFFANQFKRSCLPDGPKVGSVSLSPRGDWRMPSDADAAEWLRQLGE